MNRIHLKKKNDFVKDVNHFMMNIRNFLDDHFNKNEKSKSNPYYQIDSLVWSTIYFEKVPRYSNLVYLTSEYMIKQYEYV